MHYRLIRIDGLRRQLEISVGVGSWGFPIPGLIHHYPLSTTCPPTILEQERLMSDNYLRNAAVDAAVEGRADDSLAS